MHTYRAGTLVAVLRPSGWVLYVLIKDSRETAALDGNKRKYHQADALCAANGDIVILMFRSVDVVTNV